ncbi:MAG: AmmeMemoRadiSam system radical SAM enzyme [Phycisphaerae bacterium]|nr:AmmeMemoRadiSam system radical SAM enzyme [Phycisphaerae bacterium]
MMRLESLLAKHTMPAAPELVRTDDDGTVHCLACGHRCKVRVGRCGVCRVRFNKDGVLQVPAGYVSAAQIDPIEKKPFFHVFPGQNALSFGMLGCNFHCSYCQNWITSQTLRDDRAVSRPRFVTAGQLAELAIKDGAPAMVSTYNEPLITCDWAIDIFKPAREHGIVCGFVSNGYATPEALEFIRPYVDLYKIDLKTFDDKKYRKLGGMRDTVLDTIRRAYDMGFWVEVVTLMVPGFNDSEDEIRQIADFLASVSADIPWHVTAYHPDYKMPGGDRTPIETLNLAYQIAKEAGLRYVYSGNAPGTLEGHEDTRCSQCDTTLIRRTGFYVQSNVMVDGCCPSCKTRIPGVWGKAPPRRSTGWGMPRLVPL